MILAVLCFGCVQNDEEPPVMVAVVVWLRTQTSAWWIHMKNMELQEFVPFSFGFPLLKCNVTYEHWLKMDTMRVLKKRSQRLQLAPWWLPRPPLQSSPVRSPARWQPKGPKFQFTTAVFDPERGLNQLGNQTIDELTSGGTGEPLQEEEEEEPGQPGALWELTSPLEVLEVCKVGKFTGGMKCSVWPANACGSPWRSREVLLGGGMCGEPSLAAPPRRLETLIDACLILLITYFMS